MDLRQAFCLCLCLSRNFGYFRISTGTGVVNEPPIPVDGYFPTGYFDACHFAAMCSTGSEALRDNHGRVRRTAVGLGHSVGNTKAARVCEMCAPSVAILVRLGFFSEKKKLTSVGWKSC